jgi:hypothetical protein
LYAGILKGGDYKAYMKSALMSWIESLPPWYFVDGDNAYICTEYLLDLYMGSNHFNHYTTITGNCISILIALTAVLVTLSIAYQAYSREVIWNILIPAVVSGTTECFLFRLTSCILFIVRFRIIGEVLVSRRG